jgi:gluconate 5-dehydrogenase
MRVQDLFNLAGKTAIITGGHRGIGLHFAKGLAEAGSNVVICARNKEACEKVAADLEHLGVKAIGLACDIKNAEDVENLAKQTEKEFGGIDILVNNAGISWGAPPEDMPLEEWHRVIETNLTGTFLCCQIIGRMMIKQRMGKIINISSVGGFIGSNSMNAIGYTASKGGIIALTRDLAIKWIRYNIYVNGIAPGLFYTKMTQWITHPKMAEIYQRLLDEIPMKRIGVEEDLKGVVVFLASPASNYITGHIIPVEGGLLAW